MRTKKSVKNISLSIISNLITLVLRFTSRTVFIYILGSIYLGVNSLFYNLLTLLSLAELGVGVAIAFALYEPLSKKENIKIAAIMNFYKKTYQKISIIIFVFGLFMIPFLKYIIKGAESIGNIEYIYILFLLNTSISYLFTYKRTLIISDQCGYKIIPKNILFNIVIVFIQIVILLLFKNYYLYIIVEIIFRIIENIVINRYIEKQYPHILKYKKEELENREKKPIVKNIKAMFFHKIGELSINATDNVIISSFINVTVVGIYSNYLLIITTFQSFLMLFFNGIVASLGNYIVNNDIKKQIKIFNIIDLIAFLLFSFCSIAFYFLLSPFIFIWLGEEFVLSASVIAIVSINYYMMGTRVPITTIKNASGLYDQDKYLPVIQGIANLVLSIIFVKVYGLFGIFLGTFFSGIISIIYRPIIVYKYLFKSSVLAYFKKYLMYLLVFIFDIIITRVLIDVLVFGNSIIDLIYRFIICLIVPNILNILIFHNTNEFKSLIIFVKRSLRRKKYAEKS